MNVHRLKIEPLDKENEDNENDLDSFTGEDEDDDFLDGKEDDLNLGFGSFPNFSPQLLFATGRAKENVNKNDEAPIERHHDNLILMTEGKQKAKKPLFQ